VKLFESEFRLKGRSNLRGWSALIDMKAKVKSKKVKVGTLVAGLLTFAFCLFPFALSSSAHEPITTRVRFNKEMVRILQRSCLGCHHPGGIAFSLATYDDARPWAKAIKEEVLEKRMPPWHAVKGYGDFSNAPSLTQRDIDLIVNWVEGGAPKGDDQDLPAGPLFSTDWQLGKPDLILKPEAASSIAAYADEYRTFVLPTNVKEDRWLTGIDVLPGNASVVHCATVYLLTPEDGPHSGTAPQAGTMMQVKSEEAEWSRSIEVPRNAVVLATWIPGQRPFTFEPGIAQLMPRGSRLAIKVHYRGSGEPAKDVSAVALYFSKTAAIKRVSEITIKGTDAVITAAARPRRIVSSFTTQTDIEAIAVRPFAHPVIASLQATAYRPDGSQEVLIWVRGNQSDWQQTYHLKKPALLPRGTRVEIIVYLDSDGESSSDMMPGRWAELNQPLCTLLTTSIEATAPR
jgi:hypothetical protein